MPVLSATGKTLSRLVDTACSKTGAGESKLFSSVDDSIFLVQVMICMGQVDM